MTEDALTDLRATYRLQIQPAFDFQAAADLAAYLAALGVSHVYASPYLQAAPGSTHGYDVVDPRRVNAELGGEEGHARFVAALGAAGLGQVLDVVPNHMAILEGNPYWWDVLEKGQASRSARFFDVEWASADPVSSEKVLMPVLADHYGRVLEEGGLSLVREDGAVLVAYGERRFPLAPGSLGDDAPDLAAINADPDWLDAVLERQNYRLAFWRAAREDLDYRRFFDVTTLAGLRVEDEEVFRWTHDRILAWLADGTLDGIRIDHPDGLRDPAQYFARLRSAAPQAWIVAEKILEPGEQIPADWPIDGTTGYDYMNLLGALYVDASAEEALTSLYREFAPDDPGFRETSYAARQQILREVLAPELNRLAELLLRVTRAHRRQRDFTRTDVRAVLREFICAFPVYRTYVRASEGIVSEADVAYVETAVAAAGARRPDLPADLLEFVRDVLLVRVRGDAESEFVMRFQQLTSPVMAKGVEDTAFYRYHRLVALNEVGGDPARFGISISQFHEANGVAAELWPRSMLAGTTHDTKRSEDVRTRIALLSELPHEWAATVRSWAALNSARRATPNVPEGATEYLIYQTLVGAWPISRERLDAYLQKAMREAKGATGWADPNAEYEQAVTAFVNDVLDDPEFVASLTAFVARLAPAWQISALAQTLIRLTSPGVPDIYQGTELWDLSLVDPDNRRPVDFALRREALTRTTNMSAHEALMELDSGVAKLWLMQRCLRAESRGGYEPILAEGAKADNVVAFSRGGRTVTIAPRFVARLDGDWSDTTLELPQAQWRDELSGREIAGGRQPLAELLSDFPMALLVRSDA